MMLLFDEIAACRDSASMLEVVRTSMRSDPDSATPTIIAPIKSVEPYHTPRSPARSGASSPRLRFPSA